MTWFFFALLSAAFYGLQHTLAKKLLPGIGEWTAGAIWFATATVLFLPFLILFPPPEISATFWLVVSIRTVLEVIGFILYLRALKLADATLVTPIIAFQPLFVLGTSWLISREWPGVAGLLGGLLIVGGAFVLMNGERLVGAWKNPGVRLMFLATIAWSLCSSLHKVAIQETNPFFYAAVGGASLSIVFVLTALFIERRRFVNELTSKRVTSPMIIGVVNAFGVIFLFLAQQGGLDAVVVALGQTSLVFTTIIAYFFLGEREKRRIGPILAMVAGSILVGLAK